MELLVAAGTMVEDVHFVSNATAPPRHFSPPAGIHDASLDHDRKKSASNAH